MQSKDIDGVRGGYRVAGLRGFGVYPLEDLPFNSPSNHELASKWVEATSNRVTPYSHLVFLASGGGQADFPMALEVETQGGVSIRADFLDVQKEVVQGQVERFYYGSDYGDTGRRFFDASIATFIKWDLNASETLPYQDSSLDGVFFRYAMHWLTYPFYIVPELARVLKPGASAYIATATPWSLVVMNETFGQADHTYDQLALNYPTAEITADYSQVYDTDIWVVSHAKEIERYFETHSATTYYSRVKAHDSSLGGKQVTGFLPAYFERVAQSSGLIVEGIATDRGPHFCNQYPPEDHKSHTNIHVNLRKPD